MVCYQDDAWRSAFVASVPPKGAAANEGIYAHWPIGVLNMAENEDVRLRGKHLWRDAESGQGR